MPENYTPHNLAHFLEFPACCQDQLSSHRLLNCYLPDCDRDQLQEGVSSEERYCLEAVYAEDMLQGLDYLSACGQPVTPVEVADWLAGYLQQTPAINYGHHLNRGLSYLNRARYRNHLRVVCD